jgi:nucleoside-diphosphate-sugar epimerase
MKKILLLGESSFAAGGLYPLLKSNGFDVDCFSRGAEGRDGDYIKGDVFGLSKNRFLADHYDIVINFILIKNETVDLNIQYIKEVDELCVSKKVSNLLHISSISCYPANADFIDENSSIEITHEAKGNYASIKVAVDNYLKVLQRPYQLSFIRPGFIYSHNRKPSFSGIGIGMFPIAAFIMGNNKTPLTLINKEELHKGILKVIQTGCRQKVYLMFENTGTTKREFLLNNGFKLVIPLNRFFVEIAAFIFKKLGLFNYSQLEQVRSLFRETEYNCFKTEYELGISFRPDSYCIIGIGTYGSYVASKINESCPDAHITIFDVGNSSVKSEKEIGYKTIILKSPYNGTSKGRYFGFGGTSNKWGGQLLTFSDNDFEEPSGLLKDIVELNIKHREKIFRKFKINNKFEEKLITDRLFIKTGYWLGYFKRNLFKLFHIDKIKRLHIIPNARVVRFLYSENEIEGIEFIHNGTRSLARFDNYFLCSGAFESFRLLLNSGLMNTDSVSFSDHLSKKIFLIKGSTKIGKDDFGFKVNGLSLITKRIIGEMDGVSFCVNPNFNDDFQFFQNLKALLFRKEWKPELIKSMILDFPSFIAFAWSILVKKRIFAYKNQWELQIDIENPSTESKISLSDISDEYGEKSLDLKFVFGQNVESLYLKILPLIKNYLDNHNVNYEEIVEKIQGIKMEDTYHPYGMISNMNSVEEYFSWFKNMMVFNTGILPRAGGINTAAAVLPLIEEFFERKNC